jgi:hypothetical protein
MSLLALTITNSLAETKRCLSEYNEIYEVGMAFGISKTMDNFAIQLIHQYIAQSEITIRDAIPSLVKTYPHLLDHLRTFVMTQSQEDIDYLDQLLLLQ